MGKGRSGPPSKDSDAKWLRNFTFLIDENYCGEKLRSYLVEAGWQVKLHREVAQTGITDVELLELCAREHYVLVTPDAAMHTRDHLDVIRRHKLAMVVLVVPKASAEMWTTWSAALVDNQHAILKALRKEPRPFSVRIRVGAAKPLTVVSLAAPAAAARKKGDAA